MRTHTVAQFYLRSFQAKPGRIWKYDIQAGRWQPASIKKHAEALEDFYQPVLEDQLQKLEDRAAPAIKRLVSERLPMLWQEQERRSVSEFLAVQAARTPKFFRELVHPATQVALEKAYCRGDMDDQEYSDACEKLGNLMEGSEARTLTRPGADVVNQLIEEWTQSFCRAGWAIVEPSVELDRFQFLTSDNPVILSQLGKQAPPTAELPLSPRRLLSVGVQPRRRLHTLELVTYSGAAARGVNRRMVEMSQRYLYASARQEWVERLQRP